MNYIVYKHTSPSGKSYIGQTNNYNKRCRYHQSYKQCTAFYSAIQKYSWDNFTHEILKDNLTLEEANHFEIFYIAKYKSMQPTGYNIMEGGKNSKLAKETKDKLRNLMKGRSPSNKGISHSDESKKKMSESAKGRIPWNKGKKLSEEHKIKLAKAKIGKKQTREAIEKRVYKNTGKKRSQEFKEKMREINIGRTYSPETILKMSEGQKRRFSKEKKL